MARGLPESRREGGRPPGGALPAGAGERVVVVSSRWQGLRVLLVDAGLGGSFPFYARHIREALESELGCAVRQVGPRQLTAEEASPSRCDLILALHGIHVRRDLVRRARARGVRAALWITEDPYEMDWHTPDWLESFDRVFTNDSGALAFYRRGNVSYLPWCTNPWVFRPQEVPDAYRSDVCLVGQGFPNRAGLLNRIAPTLSGLNVKLVGNWTAWGDLLVPALKRFVVPPVFEPEEVARYYSGASICLNIHRDPRHQAIPNNHNRHNVPARSPNNRTFDIAGCGAFQLVDESRPDLARHFVPGRELVTFRSADDLAEKIAWYLSRPRLRQAIGRAARARVLAQHTFRHRLQQILDRIMGG